ncbi:acyl-CoA N-acyltransferase [Massariosphaeria phaeospora]|uniref:Acyl-CoA N-acyltransferase n=1 Tax=Massariosphaeria phaeospora TaxID=100035 RepID=A0A7C8MRY6_9PLEO|nr:acyl-CoA N-acyltransferase [Massariosphaeria phaeospora]
MTRDDLPTVGAITYKTFAEDELFAWLSPKQHLYPDDVRRSQLLRLRKRLVNVGSHGIVMVTEKTDSGWTGNAEVVGFAFSCRTGDDAASHKWKTDSIANKLERYLLGWELLYESKVLNRASDSKRMEAYAKIAQYDFYEKLDPRWHLAMFGVSPKHQRRGIGGMLVKHCQILAKEEDVPITLESSVVGRHLYLKLGFKIVDEIEIVEGLDSIAMVWEPSHLEGKWLEDNGGGKTHVKGRFAK